MAEQTQAILDLDAMMDASLDSVPDAPDFQNPPDGLYILVVEKAELDKYKDKKTQEPRTRIRVTYKVGSTLETNDVPVADGTLFSETFTGTEQGLSFFKRAAKNIMNVASIDGVSLRDILTSLTGAEFKAKITSTTTKAADSDAVYTNLRIRPVHEAQA